MIKPVILNPTVSVNRKEIKELQSHPEKYHNIDGVNNQMEEIFAIDHPSTPPQAITPVAVEKYSRSFYPQGKYELFGNWVFYPWNSNLVHFLPEDLHTKLRTARNRNLITEVEQQKYYHSRVGIAGLSVGNSAMAALLHTGGPKEMRLADFDTLSGSNTNRIRTSFANIGMKKVEIAAREIYEVNPYADLKLFPDGLDMNNLEEFLIKPEPLDVLIEEMDNIYLKIQIRILAKKYRIPVIMAADNGDNIILDIERYDMDPTYPILHNDVPEEELLNVAPAISKPEAARIIARWVRPENVAQRMQASLMELGKTLFSWPQLGNAAFLAGVALSYCTRKLILKESLKTGKYTISLDQMLDPDFTRARHIAFRNKHTTQFKKLLHLK